MTKSELVEAMAKRRGMTKALAERVVGWVFESMLDAMVRGERVEIRGFGTFAVRDYRPYMGRNPRTGASVAVTEKRAPFFKPGKELRQRVHAGGAPPIAWTV